MSNFAKGLSSGRIEGGGWLVVVTVLRSPPPCGNGFDKNSFYTPINEHTDNSKTVVVVVVVL